MQCHTPKLEQTPSGMIYKQVIFYLQFVILDFENNSFLVFAYYFQG